MSAVTLSYVLTTFNKVSFLKEVLPYLINNKEKDEEIIVIDGGSTDGTFEFLIELKRTKEIDYFLSEKDKGEAHGFNKGILLAKGDLIKVVTDDDAFNYPGIKKCKDFMHLHPEIDVIGGNTGDVKLGDRNSINWAEDFYLDFLKWKEGKLNRFFFNGTCLMLRRSSLPLIGLVDSNILLADMEYTLRMTGVVNLAWCSGIISVRILNPKSNNLIYKNRADSDSARLCTYYNYKYSWVRRKEELQKRPVYLKLRSFLSQKNNAFLNRKQKRAIDLSEPFSSFKEAHAFCQRWMEKHPLNENMRFIQKEGSSNLTSSIKDL